MNKIEFREIIREEVKKAIREELREILTEAVTIASAPSKTVEEMPIPIAKVPKGYGISDILQETAASMNVVEMAADWKSSIRNSVSFGSEGLSGVKETAPLPDFAKNAAAIFEASNRIKGKRCTES